VSIKISSNGRTTFVKKIQLGTPVRRVQETLLRIEDIVGLNVTDRAQGHILIYDDSDRAYVSGPLVGGTGLSVTHSPEADNLTVSIDSTGVVAGSYGDGANAVTLVINSQGQITSAQSIELNTENITEGSFNLFYTYDRVMDALDSISTSLRPITDGVYDLGDSNFRFKDLYLSGQTLYLGGIVLQDSSTTFTVRDSAGNNVGMQFGSIYATDSSRITANLSVDSNVTVGGNITINGNLSTSGSVIFDSSALVLGSLQVQDSASFSNNLSIDGNVLIGGTTRLNDSVSIDDNLSVNGNLLVGGDTTLNSTLSVVDSVSFSDNLTVDGTTTLNDSVSITGNVDIAGDINTTGKITGPAMFYIDPAAVGDNTGKLIIMGDLQVDGVQTTVNSTTVTINDKNIVLADSAADSAQANGAGITVEGANATITYLADSDLWEFNKTIKADFFVGTINGGTF